MPKNLKPKRRGSRRFPKSNRTLANSPTSATISSPLQEMKYHTPLFPPRFRKTLRYAEVGLAHSSGAAGIGATYFFAANGLYDPNITGAGHQPMGFDQMMLMYNHYTVVSSKITIEANNAGAYGLFPAFGIYLSPDTTNISDPARMMENGLMVYKRLSAIGGNGATGAVYSRDLPALTLGCDVSSYFARDKKKRELVEDSQLSGTSAANPAELVYFGVYCFDYTAVAVVNINFIANMIFDVIFWEPKKLTSS